MIPEPVLDIGAAESLTPVEGVLLIELKLKELKDTGFMAIKWFCA